ncbi:MAG: heterocycloanthracin/sonorensin family bacteriocin [Pirellulales bacterium]|nr:heterocycloanthracin/sonorensin family bacteriocin [Pirellulales bacterium]
MHVSVALMMGLLMTGGDDHSAPLRKQTSALGIPAPVTAQIGEVPAAIGQGVATSTPWSQAAPITTWSQEAPLPSAAYYLEGTETHAGPIEAHGGCCADCGGKCGRRECPFFRRCLFLFRTPGDMPMHIPYIAEPKNYYYFRPYNWFHIVEHQREVTFHHPPGDVRHPYDAQFMQDIYLRIEEKYGDLEVLPPDTRGTGSSPNDTLPTPQDGLLPLQTYGNQNQGDFDRPTVLPASTSRPVSTVLPGSITPVSSSRRGSR